MKEKEFIYNFCDNLQMSKDKVKIYDRGKPHDIVNIPDNLMIIYIFKYNDEYLKIGKANGKNRNKRPNIYHYNPDSCPSNLAKFILKDKYLYNSNLTKDNIKDWMINNLQRIDILIDNELGVLFLNYLESALHYTYNPKYEGRIDQR